MRELRGKVGFRPDYDHKRLREGVEQEITEEEWMRALSFNPAFAFLHDPKEDVHGPEDGVPFVEDDRG